MTDIITGRRPGDLKLADFHVPDWETPQKSYRCKVYLMAEEDGSFSVYAAALPGVASQGPTIELALENIIEAFEGVIASYTEHDEDIPWLSTPREPEKNELTRWVDVNG